ncbi:MAG: ABC transporter permease [Vampirovibrionales bacterium]|nr:ABC transporter permease [Vampirovibrionales bacterium]
MSGLHFRRGALPIFRKVVAIETDSWVLESLTTIAIPVSFYLAFGMGLRGQIQNVDGMPYMAFITPGLITMTILLEAFKIGAWNLWLGRWHNRMIHEFRIKPIATVDIIIGEILGAFTMALAKGALVALILYLLSPYALSVGALGAYLAYLFPGSILFTCFGTMVGTFFRKPDQIAQSQAIVITPLLYLGGLFFPTSAFPEWAQPLVRWLPTTALFEGGRHAFITGVFHGASWLGLCAMALISVVVAAVVFDRELSR